MPKTFLIHTDEANTEKVHAVAQHFLVADDLIADCVPGEAEKLGGDGFNSGHYEAIISAGLPNVQELVTEYKALGVICHVVGVDDPDHAARLRAEETADALSPAQPKPEKPRGQKAASAQPIPAAPDSGTNGDNP